MLAANCNSMPRIRAPYPYFNAIIHERMTASGLPIPEGLPETGRGQWSPAVEAEVDPPRRTKASDFIAETTYLKSLENKCADSYLPWKADFSQSNRYCWTQTLKYAVNEFLQVEKDADRTIDDEGVEHFVQILERAIFEYVARDPPEYGNAMAAKFDAIRGGDFRKEERQLMNYLVWL